VKRLLAVSGAFTAAGKVPVLSDRREEMVPVQASDRTEPVPRRPGGRRLLVDRELKVGKTRDQPASTPSLRRPAIARCRRGCWRGPRAPPRANACQTGAWYKTIAQVSCVVIESMRAASRETIARDTAPAAAPHRNEIEGRPSAHTSGSRPQAPFEVPSGRFANTTSRGPALD